MSRIPNGFAMIEILGALAIGALMMAGLSALVDSSLEEAKGQQAALYQAQIVNAAAKYLAANYTNLTAAATETTPVAINLDQLKTASLLPSNLAVTNGYGQTPCVLVLRASRTETDGTITLLLNALVVTEGGTAIQDKDIASIAAESGLGGGFILGSAPSAARGAFNAWNLSTTTTPTLAQYISANCSGTATSAGHLASALFYDGPGQLSTDFLYRNAVPGRPELNRVQTPIQIGIGAQAIEDASDTRCSTANDTGKIGSTANGEVLSCQDGVWRRDGARFWRDLVATYADLPVSPTNNIGDVRMVTSLSRAFTWNGTKWVALAIDELGNMLVPKRLTANDAILKRIVVQGDSCGASDPTGTVAADVSGLLLSCQNGKWEFQTNNMALVSTETDCAVILASWAPVTDAPCATPYTQSMTYAAATDKWDAPIVRHIAPTKNGLISINSWSQINRYCSSDPTRRARVGIILELFNDDTGIKIGESRVESATLKEDGVTINATLTKIIKKNSNGYTVKIRTIWTTLDGYSLYDNSDRYSQYYGKVIYQTPLSTGWNLDYYQ